MKMKKFPAPRLFQYAESNHQFYKKRFELIDTACFSESGISYGYEAIRNNSTHGRCPGGRKGSCHHCQTIGKASKEYWDFWDNGGIIL